MGKAMVDQRLLDLPLAPAFYHWMRGDALSLNDLYELRPSLSGTFKKLEQLCVQKAAIQAHESMSAKAKQEAIQALQLDGVQVDQLGLDFTLPGSPSYTLKKGGADITVSIDNLEEYLQLLLDAFLVSGVRAQLQ